MAFNFAETFLRESGTTQDRAQSMAEMQLRAKQFEQNYSLALARQKVAERAQILAEEGQEFTQTRLENLDDLSLEDRKYYQETIRPLELEQLQNTVNQNKYQTELLKAQVEDANAVMPDDIAEQLNMQKGTKWSEANRVLMGRQAVTSAKMQKIDMKRLEASEGVFDAIENIVNPKITPITVAPFVSEKDKLDPFERFGRTVSSSALNLLGTTAYGSSFASSIARDKLELELGARTETLQEYAAGKENKRVSTLLPPEQQQLRNALLQFNRLQQENIAPAIFEGYNLFQGMPTIPGFNPTQYIDPMLQGIQDD